MQVITINVEHADYSVPVQTHVPDIELDFLECRYSSESCKTSAVSVYTLVVLKKHISG